MNPIVSPTVNSRIRDLRRHSESSVFWISLIAGSILLHTLLLVALRLFWTHSGKVEMKPAPISVEFVQPKSKAKLGVSDRKASSSTSSQSTYTAPSQTVDKENATDSEAIAQPTKRDIESPQVRKHASQPSLETRPPQQFTQQPRPEDVKSPSQYSAPPKQPSQNIHSSEQSSNEPASPQTPTDGIAGDLTPSPSDSTPSGRSATEGPISSGQMLSSPLGESAKVELTGFREDHDFKRQKASPKQLSSEKSISFPSDLKQPFELQVRLFIDETGAVLEILDVQPVGSELTKVDPEELKNLARQVFKDWSFIPAQDAQDGKPLQPVRSDLIVTARIIPL